MATKDYLVPAYGASNDRMAGWLREAVAEGDAWLSTQQPASEWDAIIKRIGAGGPATNFSGSSEAEYNKTERLAREMVASLGSFSHVGEVKPQSRPDLFPSAGTLTKLDHAWHKLEETHDAHRAIIQNAVTLGTAYGWQTWDRHFHGPHKGDIRLTSLPPDCVTCLQLPSDHDLQRAYAVIIREELPITLAKRIYANTNRPFADALLPDRDSPGWFTKGLRKVQEFLSPALRVRGTRPGDTNDASFPTTDIFHMYLLDGAINDTGMPMTMGPSGTNWSYVVPSLGTPLDTGQINPATGNAWTRPAEPFDCLLFPLRRYIIFARSTQIVGYDGTSPWWHGMAPLARFRFNDWPWEALGRSCVGMVGSIEKSMNAIMQGVENSIALRLDPPYLYNDDIVGKPFADAFNPSMAGARAGAPLSQGDVVKFPVPVEHYNVPTFIPDYLKYLDGRADYLTGAMDLASVAKAKQLPSGDSMEKLLEMAGPIVQDLVHNIVMPLKTLGTMRIAYFLQFYTGQRILTETNAEGDPQDWVYEPDKLVSYVTGESTLARSTRVRQLTSEYRYSVSQSGVTEINRMTTKLFYLQLMKGNFPLDWWSFAKIAQLPRFGKEPEGTNSMLERWVAQMHMMRELQEELGGAGGPGAQRGRPASGLHAPQLKSKDGGSRTTVTQSR